jgi:hypothetical protein
MPTPTYTLLDSVTLTSSASSVTFSSIPAGGDLVLHVSGAMTSASDIEARFNGDSGSNYYRVRMYGNGSSTSSQAFTQTGAKFTFGTSVNSAILQIMDYSATDKHKTVLSRNNWTGEWVEASAIRWANTSAITTISVTGENDFAAGCTFHIYNIAKAL